MDGDPLRLIQVLGNVLGNAAKYTEPGGRITLTVRQERAEVAVRVRDTGIGIPADQLPSFLNSLLKPIPRTGSARADSELGSRSRAASFRCMGAGSALTARATAAAVNS